MKQRGAHRPSGSVCYNNGMEPDNIIHLQPKKNARTDALRNRRRLLQTAQRLFAEQGIAEVTMSAIAKEARVGKGTLYRHFGDKAELCHALLDTDMRAFQQRTLEILQKNADAAEILRWFLEESVIYTIEHSEMLREVANQIGVDLLHHPAHFWWRQTINSLLIQLEPDGDHEYMTDVLYIMLDVQTIRFQRHEQGYTRERIIAGLNMTLDRFIKHQT